MYVKHYIEIMFFQLQSDIYNSMLLMLQIKLVLILVSMVAVTAVMDSDLNYTLVKNK